MLMLLFITMVIMMEAIPSVFDDEVEPLDRDKIGGNDFLSHI